MEFDEQAMSIHQAGLEQRQEKLELWCVEQLSDLMPCPVDSFDFVGFGGDASFRRYFRVTLPPNMQTAGKPYSFIAVDAPPDLENNPAFVQVGQLLQRNSVRVPQIWAYDFTLGFMLLEDFGDSLFFGQLSRGFVDAQSQSFYRQAFHFLVDLQSIDTKVAAVPAYDQIELSNELALFERWFCQQFLHYNCTPAQRLMLQTIYERLIEVALQQPTVLVHRDFHSRNIMLLGMKVDTKTSASASAEIAEKDAYSSIGLGLIDFQDAVVGPITYDVGCLINDYYIDSDRQVGHQMALVYQKMAVAKGILSEGISSDQWLKWLDWLGLQRHLKVLGIFARLSIRDNKHQYLKDLPQAFRYAMRSMEDYPELGDLKVLFVESLLPKFQAKFPDEIFDC